MFPGTSHRAISATTFLTKSNVVPISHSLTQREHHSCVSQIPIFRSEVKIIIYANLHEHENILKNLS